MAQTDEERQASKVDALTAPEQATPGAAVLRRRPVLDSGTTIHLFSDGLRNVRRLLSPRVIRVADGRPLRIYEVGDIYTKEIELSNVYLAPEIKMDLVSVRELANIGIRTTFYKNHALLWKGTALVGHAIAEGDKSLYELTCLWASDTTPEVPSGSEPWMVAAVNGISLDFLERDDTLLLSKHRQSFDDADFYSACLKAAYIQYSSLVSKFYQSDKTGGGEAYVLYSSLVSKFYQSNKTG